MDWAFSVGYDIVIVVVGRVRELAVCSLLLAVGIYLISKKCKEDESF